MKQRKDYQKDANFFDLDRLADDLTPEQKEEFYATWRKKIEGIVEGMKHCATKKVMTRREMLAKGLTAGFATVMAPKLTSGKFSWFSEAEAQGMPPFGVVVLEAYGGWVPSKQIYASGGSSPTDMTDAVKASLGIRLNGAEATPQTLLGATWNGNSQFIAAFRTALGNDNTLINQISDRTQAMWMSSSTDDDNGNQANSSSHLFMQVLGAGVSTAGVRANVGGGNYQQTHPAALSVLQANNATQAAGLPGSLPVGSEFAQAFGNANSVAVNTAVQKALKALNNRNIISKAAMEAEAKQILMDNAKTFEGKKMVTPPGTNVFNQATDANLFTQIFPNSGNNNIQMALATVGHLVTNPAAQGGLRAPFAVVGLGGYDSHQGANASNGSATSLGEYVGRLLRLANARSVALTVMITTDGSQFQSSSGVNNANDNWVGDFGGSSGVLMFHFKPNGRPALASAGQYVVGGFNPNTVTGGNRPIALAGQGKEFVIDAKFAAEAAVLNTLAAHGQLSRWSKAQGTIYTPDTAGIVKFQV